MIYSVKWQLHAPYSGFVSQKLWDLKALQEKSNQDSVGLRNNRSDQLTEDFTDFIK